MLSSFFSKKENDLDGYNFRKQFETTKNAVLLDVRTPAEYAEGTIPGAENLDYMAPDFQNRIKTLDPDKTYFAFCRSGNRSGGAVSQLSKNGLKAFNLVGGIGAWPRG